MNRPLPTALFFTVAMPWLSAQTPQPRVETQVAALPSSPADPSAVTPGASPELNSSERTKDFRDTAETLREAFEKLQTGNLAEIDKLMKDKPCNIVRVDSLLARTNEALDLWSDAESKFWTVNAEIETAEIERKQKSVANLQSDRRRAQDLVDFATKDREKLEHDLAELQKYAVRNYAIQEQIDQLSQDLKDCELRLNKARETSEDLSARTRSLQGSMGARLARIREAQRGVGTWVLDMKSYYDKIQLNCTAQEGN